ncbi:MAG TPA: HEAT repeat domain-containing protein, partial [Gemmatimonadaceae bacterium]|nr:HEAT repeat domain-containing protein [Gemmatimonadaceae bacterium]
MDTLVLDSAIASRWPALRAAGTLAVGQLHAAARAPRLRLLLADSDTTVAASAAFALGLMRDSAAVSALASSLRVSAPVAREAAWSLGEIGSPARAAILDALGAAARGSATAVVARALPALLVAAGKLRPLPVDVIAPFAAPAPSRDVEVTRAAAYALARARSPGGARTLLALATHSDAEVREQVARGLARAAAGDSLGDSARVVLARLAADPSAHVRVNAVRSLGSYGPAARRALVALLHDGDANVRVAVAQSLGGVLGSSRRDWREAWDADTSFMFRRSLVASAVTSGVILNAIDEDNPDNWQRVPDWRYRAAVAEAAAGATQIERIVEVSLPLTRDEDGRVRAAAYGVFAPYVDSAGFQQHPWRRQFLLPALRDADFTVRASVLDALAGRARADEVPVVLQSYRLAMSDTSNDARVAAVRYFAAAWRSDSAAFGDSLRATLRALPSPSDPLERAAGRGVSLFSHWTDAADAPHPLSWYEDVMRTIVLPSLAGRSPRAEVVTERGSITVELFGADAPLTVLNFTTLARRGFLRDTRFHRVVPNFVAQDGDPR